MCSIFIFDVRARYYCSTPVNVWPTRIGGEGRVIPWFRSRDLLDRTFEIGIVLKGLNGLLELVGGVLLLAVSPATINRIVVSVTQGELSEDPHDVVAHFLRSAAHSLTSSTVVFGALYLLTHGIVKVVLVLSLLRDKLWAYPWMILFLLVFIVYQGYRLTFAPSLWLVGLTVFDIVIAWLTWREYRKHRRIVPTQYRRCTAG
jgi:uncharacterized membrane protein